MLTLRGGIRVVNKLRIRKLIAVAILVLTMASVQSVVPQPVHAAGGTISGTITLNGQPAPAGSYYVVAVRYDYNAISPVRCQGAPLGLPIAAIVNESGSYSISVPVNSGYKILFKPLSIAPKSALQRWYSSLSAAGTENVFSIESAKFNETCIHINNNNASGINLVTNSATDAVTLTGSLTSSTGDAFTSANVLVSKTIESMYWSKGKGYATSPTSDGRWEVAGIDTSQTVYIQVHAPIKTRTMFCAIPDGSTWSMVAATNLTCPSEAAIQLGTTDITGIQLRLPQTGLIRGTVSGPDGPVKEQQVCVEAYRTGADSNNYYSSLSSQACTNENGVYEVGVPYDAQQNPTTTYQLLFRSQYQSGLISEWHQDVSLEAGYAGSTSVSVPNSTPVLVNATLGSQKYIAGRITNSQGVAVANAQVSADRQHPTYGFRMTESTALTDSNGNYRLFVLTDGTYTVSASHPDYTKMYLGQSETFDGAAMVVIDSNVSSISSQSIVLSAGLTLSGALLTSDGQQTTACITAFQVDEENPSFWGEYVSANCFSSPGDWKIGGLRPAKYKLRVSNSQGYQEGFVGGPGSETATTYTLLNASRINLDVTLNRGKTINGKIRGSTGTGESGICVNAGKLNSGDMIQKWERWSCTNSSGEFSLSGLESGRYVLRVQPPASTDYGRGFATSSGFLSTEQSGALIVDVSGSDSVVAISDQMMSSAPKFTAIVRDGSGTVANVCLTAYLKNDDFGLGQWIGSGCSASNGAVSISGLVSGGYRIRVEPRNGIHQAGWHKSSQTTVSSWTEASLITVSPGADVIALNTITLAEGASASGTLMNGTTPVGDACVTAFKTVNGMPSDWVGQSCVSQTGKFKLTGLDRTASYIFRVDSYAGRLRSGYIDNNRIVVNGFTNVAPRSLATDIDLLEVSLTAAPIISGTIVSGNQSAEGNVCVTAHDATTLNWMATSCSSSNGKYILRGLNDNGQYKLSWWSGRPLIGPGWFSSTNPDATTPTDAEIITISGSTDRTLDIRVPNAGSITGSLSTAGLCVAAWTVNKTDYDNQVGERDNASAIACSNQKGDFTLRGLRPNVDYFLQAFSPTGASVTQNSPSGDTAFRTGSVPVSITVS